MHMHSGDKIPWNERKTQGAYFISECPAKWRTHWTNTKTNTTQINNHATDGEKNSEISPN